MNCRFTGLFIILIISLIILTGNILRSQTETVTVYPDYKIGGQLRYRGEIDLRYFDMNAKALFVNMLRTRINGEFKISPNLRAYIQLQDSRNFGEEKSTAWSGTLDGTADNIDLHQGWAEFTYDSLTFKLGRMMFATNSERIIGNLEWHNIARGYDGGWAAYKFSGWQARAFAFLLGSKELAMTSATPQTSKMLGGLELNIPYIPSGNVYAYYDLNDKAITAGGSPSSLPALSRYTLGLFTKSESPGFVWEFEAAMQTGTIDTLPRLRNSIKSDISAWMASAYAGYKTDDFTIGGGVDVYTGDDPGTDAYEGFDHIFFTLHKFYGGMDFFPFTVLPVGGIRPGIEGTNQGLIMPNIKASWIANSRWKFDGSVMMFSTLETYHFGTEELKNIGTEIDLVATCGITKGVNWQIGSSLFLPGEILEKTNPAKGMGTDPAYWGYTMLSLEF